MPLVLIHLSNENKSDQLVFIRTAIVQGMPTPVFLLNFTDKSREVFFSSSTLIIISSQLAAASKTYLSDT